MFMMAIGLVMTGLATWQRVKPTPEVGYVPYDAAAQPD